MNSNYLFIFLLFAFAPLFMTAQSWQEVGDGGFSDGEAYGQKMAVDGLIPYVAYSDNSNNNQITVKKYNGLTWETFGAFGESVSELDFVIENGIFYIVYVTGSSIYVKTLAEGQWINEGPSPLANGDNVCISISDGIPFIAFQDDDYANKISVLKLTNSGWEYLGEPGFTSSSLSNVVDIEVDNSVAYVAYRDTDNDYKASVMKFENDNWSVLGNEGFSGGTHDSYNALAIYNNEPYVTSWKSDAQAAVYKFDGTGWQQIGSAISTGIGRYLSLRTSTLNELYIAYTDEAEFNKIFVKKLNGSSWVDVGNVVSLSSAEYLSMAFDTNGQPYLAYRDDNYLRRTTVMTYGIDTGVKQVLDKSTIQIYPNPTENHLQISNNGSEPINSFAIYDQAGRLIMEHNSAILGVSLISNDISSILPGQYYIQMRTKNGLITYKFVKQ